MKILFINGSPNENGNTANPCLNSFERQGIRNT